MTKNKTLFSRIWEGMIPLAHNLLEDPFIWLTLNMVITSGVLWPGEPIHVREISFLFALCYIVGAFARLIYGPLADKFPRIRLIGLCKILGSAAFFAYGFVREGSGTNGFYYLIVVSVIREIFIGTEALYNSFMDDAVEERKRSRSFGIIGAAGQLSFLIGTLVGAILLKYYWHEFFFVIGGLGVLIGIAVMIWGEEPKRAAERQELKQVLQNTEAVYNYKLSPELRKTTLFSKSNRLLFIEGIFSQISHAVSFLLLFAYLESAPYNVSPVNMALMSTFFGGTGMIIGSLIFAKISDVLAEKAVKYRILLIMGALAIFSLICVAFFYIPYAEMTPEQGNSIRIFYSYPQHWILGGLYFLSNALGGVFSINQKPLMQKLNLPEAQGQVNSINSFLEILSIGIGGLLSGILIDVFGGSYILTTWILAIVASVGIALWGILLKYVGKDLAHISEILKKRGKEIEQQLEKSRIE